MQRVLSILVASSITAGCGGGTEVDAAPPDMTTVAPVASIASPVVQNGPLMISTGVRRDTLVLVDPVDGSSRVIDHPPHLVGDPGIVGGVGGPDGVYALVMTAHDGYLFDVAAGAVQNTSPLGELLGVSPLSDPEAALFTSGDRLDVVDLRRGVVIDAGPADPGLARLDVDARTRRAVVSRGAGGGELVDLDLGDRATISEENFLIGDALDGQATRVSATRDGSGPVDRQLVVFDFDDPDTWEVWYEPATLDAQLASYAWTGDVIVAVDLTGRVFVLDGSEPQEIGRLGDSEVVASRVYGGDGSGTILVSQPSPTGQRWYRIDPASRDITPLPELDGLEPLGGERLPDALIVGDGGEPPRWSRVVAVPIAAEDTVEVVAFDAPRPLDVSFVGGGLVGVTVIEDRVRMFSFVDVRDGAIVGEGSSTGGVVVSPDFAALAHTPNLTSGVVVVRGMGDPSASREVIEGEAIAWLPEHG